LPHWRLRGATYFVTWRLHQLQLRLTPEERSLVVSALRYFDGMRFTLIAFVVMDDHVHVVVQPMEEHRLEMIVHSWKSFTARSLQRQFGRKGRVWQDEYFDRIVRNDAELLATVEYVAHNPSERWPELTAYPWLGFQTWEAGTEARPTEK